MVVLHLALPNFNQTLDSFRVMIEIWRFSILLGQLHKTWSMTCTLFLFSDSVLQSSGSLSFFKWLPLSSSDRHILAVTDSRLQNSSPTLVSKSCEFLADVLFKDFPAEIFLQRPSVFKVKNIVSYIVCFDNEAQCRKHGWSSGESARLSPMQWGFEPCLAQCRMWVELFVGSLLCFGRFSLGSPVFLLP